MGMSVKTVAVAAALIAAALPASYGIAQNYPLKAVRMIVPFSAGSGSDTIGRMIAGALSESFAQQFIVDNRAGAAGNIGADIAAKAAADGYTLLFANIGHAANVTLYKNLPYDITRDFAPVTQVASAPAIVVVHPSLPVKSIAELVKLAKAKPAAINYSSGGAGTATFIAAELFTAPVGIQLLHVPYRAGGEALTAVLSGETSVYFAPLATALPHVRQGRLRALAVTSAKRSPELPDVPTVAQAGVKGYDVTAWFGMVAPKGTPREVVTKLHTELLKILKNPDVQKQLLNAGQEVAWQETPELFGEVLQVEAAKWARMVTESGAQVN